MAYWLTTCDQDYKSLLMQFEKRFLLQGVMSVQLYLGNIVIGVSLQLNGDAAAQPGSQRLASVPSQLDVNGVCRQACLAKLLRHLMTQGGTCCPTAQSTD